MAKTAGATGMSPQEDRIAALCAAAGYSFKKIALMMGRSDRAVASAVERAKTAGPLSSDEIADAEKLKELQEWLNQGSKKNFLEAVSKVLGRPLGKIAR